MADSDSDPAREDLRESVKRWASETPVAVVRLLFDLETETLRCALCGRTGRAGYRVLDIDASQLPLPPPRLLAPVCTGCTASAERADVVALSVAIWERVQRALNSAN